MFVVMKLSQISGQNSSHHSLCVFAYLSSPSVDLAIYLGGGGGGRNNLIIVIFLKVYSCVLFWFLMHQSSLWAKEKFLIPLASVALQPRHVSVSYICKI